MKKVYVVGIGPGNEKGMTQACRDALAASDYIVGYTGYTQLVQPLYPDKKYVDTGMTREVDRCRRALELADEGSSVSVICSGDSGIYGMAGLVFELGEDFAGIDIEVVPGITAASSGGALLGAPLGHDFAVISLSDLLTPWELIENRLECAAMADFAISIYNPGSKGRVGHLKMACDVLLRHKPASTVCGLARNIGREGEGMRLTTLGELRDTRVDMTTTVFIGNSSTRVIDGKMVTPRGYRHV